MISSENQRDETSATAGRRRSRAGRLIVLGSVALGALLIMCIGIRFTGRPPERPAIVTELPGCPSSPNCVVSQGHDADEAHYIEPLKLGADPVAEWLALREVVQSLGGELKRSDERYLHFEFRSRIFGFVDDVECLLNEDARQVEIRSASRVGHSDLGVNRKRVEKIRQTFAERMRSSR